MRICLVDCLHDITHGYSGAVDRILNFSNNLSKNNIDIFIIDENSDNYYTINNNKIVGNKYPKYITFFLLRKIYSISLRLLRLFYSKKGEIQYIPNIFNIILLFKIIYVVHKEKIDIIQAVFPPSFLQSYIIGKLFGLPIIFEEHNIESIRLIRTKSSDKIYGTLRVFETFFCKLSNCVFTVSEIDKKLLIAWGVSSKKIYVIPNSVDIEKYVPGICASDLIYRYDLRFPTFIFHGSFDYLPNAEALKILIEIIFPLIKAKFPESKLLIVGQKPPQIYDNNIIVTGPVENLPDYIAASDIAIVPLLTGGGTRIKILEYMAMGKPIISTKIGAEGIEAVNGVEILISENIDDSFMQMILITISDSNLRRSLGENARKLIVDKYSWENTTKKALEIYKEILNIN